MSQSTASGNSNPSDSQGIRLPARVIVSLRAGAVLAIANILCVVILAWAWVHVHYEPKSISVTGSARKNITSDLIVWRCKVFGSDANLQKAYAILDDADSKVQLFLHASNVLPEEIAITPVSIRPIMTRNANGQETNDVARYELTHDFEISSAARVGEIEAASRGVTTLIRDGVYLTSDPPDFIYTKLSDLKIEMLAAATHDATTRAQQIASNSGGELGAIVDARMGVMQINPVNDYDATGSGVNDLSSREKAITAVVTARFSLK